MRCIHLNIRTATFILLAIMCNGIKHSQMADNHMEESVRKESTQKTTVSQDDNTFLPSREDETLPCPSHLRCNELQYPCIKCTLNTSCHYGKVISTMCHAKNEVVCKEARSFERKMICRYCYQTEPWEHSCQLHGNCNSVDTPRHYYQTNCTANDDVICLGHRRFRKRVPCNWTGGYRWSTALALSITLGGFGADRFYLGHWQEGIGKLFSFGGLGVWTLIDVVLISLHYLGPADGSLYL